MHALQGSFAFSVPKRAAFLTIISVSPMMALSGVRSSWLTLETNCDLCSLASASCRFLGLDFVEQPHVLDRDRRLVGESRYQRRKRCRLHAGPANEPEAQRVHHLD
jgi:hypothetical protein